VKLKIVHYKIYDLCHVKKWYRSIIWKYNNMEEWIEEKLKNHSKQNNIVKSDFRKKRY